MADTNTKSFVVRLNEILVTLIFFFISLFSISLFILLLFCDWTDVGEQIRLKILGGDQWEEKVNAPMDRLIEWNQTLPKHSGPVHSVSFSPNGKLLGSLEDSVIMVWSLEANKELNKIVLGGEAYSFSFSPDSKYLATGVYEVNHKYHYKGFVVQVLSVETGEIVRSFLGHSKRINCVSFSPNGKLVASGSKDKTIRVWSMETGEAKTLPGHSDEVRALSFSPDNKVLISGSWDRTMRIWSFENGREIRTLVGRERINNLAFSPDGKFLVSTGATNIINPINLWSFETGRPVELFYKFEQNREAIAFSPDSKLLVTAKGDTIEILSVELQQKIGVLWGHTKYVTSVSFHPDGKMIASGSDDGTVKLWKLK